MGHIQGSHKTINFPVVVEWDCSKRGHKAKHELVRDARGREHIRYYCWYCEAKLTKAIFEAQVAKRNYRSPKRYLQIGAGKPYNSQEELLRDYKEQPHYGSYYD